MRRISDSVGVRRGRAVVHEGTGMTVTVTIATAAALTSTTQGPSSDETFPQRLRWRVLGLVVRLLVHVVGFGLGLGRNISWRQRRRKRRRRDRATTKTKSRKGHIGDVVETLVGFEMSKSNRSIDRSINWLVLKL